VDKFILSPRLFFRQEKFWEGIGSSLHHRDMEAEERMTGREGSEEGGSEMTLVDRRRQWIT
jgi:hypothetical protein